MDLLEILGKVGFDTKVFIFNLINFAILAFLLKKFLFQKVATILAERKKLIDEGISKAEIAGTEISMAKEQADQIVKAAKEEGRDVVKTMTQQATIVAEKIKTEAKAESKQIVDKAKDVAEQEKNSIMENVRKDAAKLITDEFKSQILASNK